MTDHFTAPPGWWGEDVVPYIPLRIVVREGALIPRGYAVAYWQLERAAAVCMPEFVAPIVGGLRALRHWLRFPPWRSYEWRLKRAQVQGFVRGYDRGYMDRALGRPPAADPLRS